MKKTSFIVFALALLFICRPLMAQTSFKDLPVEFRKNGYPQLIEECKWIATTCWEVKHSVDTCYVNCIRDFIKWQSAAQFAVAGVVYEDMYTQGFYEPYVFKDGVTVYVADSTKMPADKHCTDEQLDFYLHLTNDDLKPNTGAFVF